MTINEWELYDSHKDYTEANAKINAAWEHVKSIYPAAEAAVRAKAAEEYMYRVLQTYSRVGALDTEPVAHLRHKVEKHFGVRGNYI